MSFLGASFLAASFVAGSFLVISFLLVSGVVVSFLASTVFTPSFPGCCLRVSFLPLSFLETSLFDAAIFAAPEGFFAAGRGLPVGFGCSSEAIWAIQPVRGLLTSDSISLSFRRKTVCNRLGSFERSQSQVVS